MSSKAAVALLFIGLNFYGLHQMAHDDVIPERGTFARVPDQIGDWQCNGRQTLPKGVLGNLGVTDYLLCDFTNQETSEWIDFYVGYHQDQARSETGKSTIIHPPEHCLPGAGWDIIQSEFVPIDFGIPGRAKRIVAAKGNLRSVVYFWYQSRGRIISSSFERMLYMFWDRARTGRTDGSLIRFTIPIRHGEEAAADATFGRFARKIMPRVSPLIPN